MAIYLVDIDGVICTKGHKGKYVLAQPIQENIDKINRLKDWGHAIILYTARLEVLDSTKIAVRTDTFSLSDSNALRVLTIMQLGAWGVKYDSINWTKPESDYIIDDKMITLDEAIAT